MDLTKLVSNKNINNLLNSADLLSSVIDTAALITPQEDVGFNGWLFHIPQDETLEFYSEVTDHYVEDNTAVQDHVALRPVEFTVTGLIGELNWKDVYDKNEQQVAEIQNRLPVLSILTPELTAQALQVFNTVNKAYDTAKKLDKMASDENTPDVYKRFLDEAGNSFNTNGRYKEQELAVNYFFWAWKSRKLFKVQTPWRIFDNMIIKSCRASQSESGRTTTNITLTFKQLNIIDWKILNKKSKMARNATQAQEKVDRGTSRTEHPDSTYLLNKYGKYF